MVQRLNTSDTSATVKGVAVIKLSRTIMKESKTGQWMSEIRQLPAQQEQARVCALIEHTDQARALTR